MWSYHVSTGQALRADGVLEAIGYSGFGADKNNTASERKAGLGPIPRGLYRIGALSDNDSHGPLAIHLEPLHDTDTFGRSGFLIHGDKIEAPGTASHGCIILPRAVRQTIFDSDDKLLEVAS